MQAKQLFPIAFILFGGLVHSQEKDGSVVAAMGRMARAKSVAELVEAKPKTDGDYAVQAVFAVRRFEIMPSSKHAAMLLLNAIPRNEDEQNTWMNMGSSQCDQEPVQDITSLAALADRFARDLARAAILVPERMRDYVWYAAEASSDPHSDYAVQMQKVCRKRHSAFTTAVHQLDKGSGISDYFTTASPDWFRAHILNTETCRALTFPEAD